MRAIQTLMLMYFWTISVSIVFAQVSEEVYLLHVVAHVYTQYSRGRGGRIITNSRTAWWA